MRAGAAAAFIDEVRSGDNAAAPADGSVKVP